MRFFSFLIFILSIFFLFSCSSDDECTTNSDCTDSSKPICEEGVCVAEQQNECTTNSDCTDSSKPVCSNGTCIAQQSDAPFHILATAHEFQNGSSYYIPMNDGSSTVALFSEQREAMGILNDSDGSIVINKMEIIHGEGVMVEEYSLQTTDLVHTPLEISNYEIAQGGRLDFYVRFYPVESSSRAAVLKITYNTSSVFTLNLTGAGRDSAYFTENATLSLNKVLGGMDLDEMISGSATDSNGNTFFYGHVTQVSGADRFGFDLFYGKITAAGELSWLKIWNGAYRDFSNDPGQNGETGGSANSIAVDSEGNLYLVGATSPSSSNNNFAALVLKIDGSTGSTIWQKQWRPKWATSVLAWHNAMAYGVDVKGDNLYVTGSTLGEAAVMFLVFNKADGTLVLNKAIDVYSSYNDRGYAVKVDDNNNAYIGGSANGKAFLMKLESINSEPVVAWSKDLSAGTGSNVNSLDLDSNGDLYASVDIRGAATSFSFIKVSSSGALVWGKEQASSNDSNNVHIVRVLSDKLYVGGRVGISAYDVQMGDGYLVRTSLDGTIDWSMFYYTGKGPDEIAEYRVKGLGLVNNSLYVVGQIYTGTLNGYRYDGYWYNGFNDLLTVYSPTLSEITLPTGSDIVDHIDLAEAGLTDSTVESRDMPMNGAKDTFFYQDANAKHDGYMPDGEMSFMKMELK
ncbi:hypothetical protein JXR93_03420 [bacterium]|nr:hypothetical protein [bacterium]